MPDTPAISTELALRPQPAGESAPPPPAAPAASAVPPPPTAPPPAARPDPAAPPKPVASGSLPARQPAWQWPGPAAAPGPVPLFASIGAGVLAAIMVPLGYTGIGWVLAGLAAAVAVVASLARPISTRLDAPSDHAPSDHAPSDHAASDHAASERPPPTRAPDRQAWRGPVRHRWEAVAWGLAALVLLSVGALRAAEWLFGLCLFGAAVAITLAITGGRTVRGMALGALLVSAAGWRGLAWAKLGLTGLRRRVHPGARLGRTIVVTVAALLLFGALFASADAAFSRLLGFAVPDVGADSVLRWTVLFGIAGTFVLAAVYLRLAPPVVDEEGSSRRTVRLVEWVVPVGALVALFASFVAVQLTVLFGGVSYVLEVDGLTYADHARGGFWQLLAVTVLTLLVIGVVARLAPRDTPVERWCLRGLLGALGILTLAIVASALFRMHTYQEAYGFTRMRVLVSIVELWLGLVFLLVLAAGVRLRASWLPRAVAATGIVALLALAALNPDRFIAERNLDRWFASERSSEASDAAGVRLDTAYLGGLSADAVPALLCLPEPDRSAVLERIRADLATEPSDWRHANLANAIARSQLAGGSPPADCPGR